MPHNLGNRREDGTGRDGTGGQEARGARAGPGPQLFDATYCHRKRNVDRKDQYPPNSSDVTVTLTIAAPLLPTSHCHCLAKNEVESLS
jgi:hypothetical protein